MRVSLKPLLGSLLFVMCFPTVAAGWSFTYSNLCDGDNCINLSGSFAGTDINRDGILSLSELTSLDAGIFNFRPGGTVDSFSYAIGGDLDFSARTSGYRYEVRLVAGQRYTVTGPFDPNGDFFATPETILQISSAVPEPSTAFLLLAGLFAASWRIRRSSTSLHSHI
jgi:hypothetical protein